MTYTRINDPRLLLFPVKSTQGTVSEVTAPTITLSLLRRFRVAVHAWLRTLLAHVLAA
jgi:CRISPR/Cas system CMR subunit Cmr4 (Cas7 group RAMP superfamily)